MNDLQTTAIGGLDKDSIVATANQISSYIDGIISADSVALGGGLPDIKTKANNKGIAIGLSSSIGDETESIAIGTSSYAKNYGVAIGLKANAELGFALGPDACALCSNSVAIGRYACVSAKNAVQINGTDKVDDKYVVYNDLSNSFKFYNGSINKTIVGSDGKISADTTLSVAVTDETAEGNPIKNMKIKFVNAIPETPEDGVLYFTVE